MAEMINNRDPNCILIHSTMLFDWYTDIYMNATQKNIFAGYDDKQACN